MWAGHSSGGRTLACKVWDHLIEPAWWGAFAAWAILMFQPVVHNWSIKGYGMCCSVCGKVHIKDPLLLIGKCNLCGDSVFHLEKYA